MSFIFRYPQTHPTMKANLLLSSSIALPLLLLASCSVPSDEYDTPRPYVPQAEMENPVYDSPPAYEQDMPGNPAALDPGLPADPGASPQQPPSAQASPTPAPAPHQGIIAVVHTVEKGDTLSGLSARYKVPMESIRRANNMTNDTVVLGRRMIIPAR